MVEIESEVHIGILRLGRPVYETAANQATIAVLHAPPIAGDVSMTLLQQQWVRLSWAY